MKPGVIVAIILGSAFFLTGGAILGFGISQEVQKGESSIEEKEIEITENITSFNVDLATSTFELKPSDGTEKVVRLTETEKNYHVVEVKDGVLNIKQEDTREWYEKIFDFSSMKNKVTVYVPTGNYDAFTINAATGLIDIENGFSFGSFNATLSTGNINFKVNVTNELKMETSTGNINIDGANVNKLTLKATTGHINISNTTVIEDITLETSTGNIYLVNVTGKSYKSVCSTGHVLLKNVVINENIDIETTTGDVYFDDSDASKVKVKTTTGDVKGTFLSDKIIHAQTKSGHVDVPRLTTGGLCEVETVTGDIILKIKE